MVAPTSPLVKTISELPAYHSQSSGFKQARPFTLVLPYVRKVGYNTKRIGKGSDRYPITAADVSACSTHWDDPALVSAAYERLRGMLSNRASMGVSLLELDRSVTMMQSRLIQISRFGRQLARGNLVGAARELKMSAVPKGASTRKSFSNNYLEFHFGWAPLIGDVYSTIDVLQSPVKSPTPKGSARGPLSDWKNLSSVTNNWDTAYWRRFKVKRRVIMGAEVTVSNPNLWLANQLGLVNPAVLIYEKIPFSFVADWFINVEQFLSRGTDYYGLALDKAYTTFIDEGNYDLRDFSIYFGGRDVRVTGNFLYMERRGGLSKPILFVRPFKVFGWRRLAAAASLVVQQLTKK